MPLNASLASLLSQVEPKGRVRFLVEVPENRDTPILASALSSVPGVSQKSALFNYIPVSAPLSSLQRLESYSSKVHYDAPMRILPSPSILDPILGKLSISDILVRDTRRNLFLKNARNIIPSALSSPGGLLTKLGLGDKASSENLGIHIIPTSETRKLLLLPEDTTLYNTRVAVIDTGLTIPHPQFNPIKQQPVILSTTVEPPFDALGHGQWCSTAAFGGKANTAYGEVEGVALAKDRNLISVKALTSFGFGLTSSILGAMQIAWKLRARVVSMSLGGLLQGSVEEDPQCAVIKKLKDEVIFVVAAGNSGPGLWTIDSPGASPYAVTVAAYSSFYSKIAFFSSRGPNSSIYAKEKTLYKRDSNAYAGDFFKPDVSAPGGGGGLESDPPDMIYSGVTGWINGQYDNNPLDGYEPMRGTSMACPHAAAVIALAVEHGYVSTARDVKDKMGRWVKGSKDNDSGYGFITYTKLR